MSRGDHDAALRAHAVAPDLWMAGDSSLVAALVSGDREALAEIYERHSAAVYDVAHALVGEALATSVVQRTFLELWLEPDGFDPSETLRSHLSKKAHLAAVGRRRGDAAGARTPRRSRESAQHAWPLLSLLPDDERSAIWMTYFVGYSARELAQRLQQPERIIRQRITDGLRRLRTLRTVTID